MRRWTPKLNLSGGFTLANHTYAFTDTVRSASSSISNGDQIDTAPHALGYMQIAAAPTDALNIALKWQHMGAYYTDPGNTAKYPGHDIFTLRGLYDVTKNISVYGRVDNIFNTAYANRADFAFGDNRYFPGRPRALLIGVRFKE